MSDACLFLLNSQKYNGGYKSHGTPPNSHTGISRLLAYIGLLSSLPSLSHGQKDVLATGDGSNNFCNYLEEKGRTRPVRKKAEVRKIYRSIDNRCMDR